MYDVCTYSSGCKYVDNLLSSHRFWALLTRGNMDLIQASVANLCSSGMSPLASSSSMASLGFLKAMECFITPFKLALGQEPQNSLLLAS